MLTFINDVFQPLKPNIILQVLPKSSTPTESTIKLNKSQIENYILAGKAYFYGSKYQRALGKVRLHGSKHIYRL